MKEVSRNEYGFLAETRCIRLVVEFPVDGLNKAF
jgi:hypothetical protein